MDAKVPKPSDPQLVQRTQSSAREAWRMFEIIAEFVTATERLHSVHPAVTIFGSARVKPGERWYTLAEDISRRLSDAGFSVISGGGPGVMEAANKGAFAGPSPSVGLNIQLPHEQSANAFQDVSHTFQHFFARKVMFVKLSCAFVMLPGGFGTLDELFETLTLVQTGKSRARPILLFGRAFWEKLINFQHLIDTGMISPGDEKLIRFVETAEEAWEVLASHYGFDEPPTVTGEFADDI